MDSNNDNTTPTLGIGSLLGPWRIDGILGQGGMGRVWSAHRSDGAYEQAAAIKVLLDDVSGHKVVERFLREQQLLARASHPRVARLLDAGRTSAGDPYFVMERVNGQTLDVVARHQSLAQKLNLFLQLCDAVAHAHKNLLVHRDIKPNNVLVDAEGNIKLLDFGVAKLVEPEGGQSQSPDLTGTFMRGVPLTPMYASPEQIKGEAVSTASDIYSLGAVLYLLLTGTAPHSHAGTTAQQVALSVITEDPQRPSKRAMTTNRSKLAADLDAICLTALKKAPEERYSTVDAMAADVRAYVSGHPVSVQVPSFAYVARRFVQRNKLVSGLGVAAVVAVMGGLGASLWQYAQARDARDAAQLSLSEVQGLTQDIVIRFTDAIGSLPKGQDMQIHLLDSTAKRLDALLLKSPADAELMVLAASTHARIAEAKGNTNFAYPGDAEKATAAADRALVLTQQAAKLGLQSWQRAHAESAARVIKATRLRDSGQPGPGVEVLLANLAQLARVPVQSLDPVARAEIMGQQALTEMVAGGFYFSGTRANLNQSEPAFRHNANALRVYQAMLADAEALQASKIRQLPGEPALDARIRMQTGLVHGYERSYFQQLDQLEESAAAAQRAIAVLSAESQTLLVRDQLVAEWLHMVHMQGRMGKSAQAQNAMGEGMRLINALAQEQGPQSKWAVGLPMFELWQGWVSAQQGDFAKAQQMLSKSMTSIPERAAQADLRTGGFRQLRAQTWVAALQAKTGDWRSAQKLIDGVNKALEERLQTPRYQRSAQLLKAQLLGLRAHALDQTDAAAARQQALDLLDLAAKALPLAADHQRLRAHIAAGEAIGTHVFAF
jgi:hypothetical protein